VFHPRIPPEWPWHALRPDDRQHCGGDIEQRGHRILRQQHPARQEQGAAWTGQRQGDVQDYVYHVQSIGEDGHLAEGLEERN
jgi:hypothetical protein